MSAHDDESAIQSCIDPGCDLDWRGHTPEQADRCLAYAMYEAYTDLRDDAEIRAELAAGDPTASEQLERRAREAARLASGLGPVSKVEAEAER